MNCPNCGNEWDASKGPCAKCGFTTRMANYPEQTARSSPVASSAQSSTSRSVSHPLQPLLPGVSLRSGRYRLQEKLEQQNWPSGVFEASWIARDFRYNGAPVSVYEVIVPDTHMRETQAILRTSTHALLAAGRHPCIPTLHDVFNDQDRTFFVFEPFAGESLQMRLNRLRSPLSESEVIRFCIQMSELLGLLASQSPPLIHGRICPEHIYLSYDASRCSLSSLSPIVASGIKQLIMEAVDVHSRPYTAPELSQGVIDTHSDLYSLLATAYYAVTGTVPTASGGVIPQARHLNAAISADFNAILAKGLHPIPHRRYQHAAELSHDLLAVRSRAVSSNLALYNNVNEPVSAPPARENMAISFESGASASAYPFPIMLNPSTEDEGEEMALLPSPEMLPPMRQGNDFLIAAAVFMAMLLGTSLIAFFSHFTG